MCFMTNKKYVKMSCKSSADELSLLGYKIPKSLFEFKPNNTMQVLSGIRRSCNLLTLIFINIVLIWIAWSFMYVGALENIKTGTTLYLNNLTSRNFGTCDINGASGDHVLHLTFLSSLAVLCVCWAIVSVMTTHGGTSQDDQSCSSEHDKGNDKPVRASRRRLYQEGPSAARDDKGMSGRPPVKKGRKSTVHPDKKCGNCSVWLQTGTNKEEESKHLMNKNMGHPGELAVGFQAYLSVGDTSMTIQADSCMCRGFFEDCKKNHNSRGVFPRWYKLRSENKTAVQGSNSKHCHICHYMSIVYNTPTHVKK